MKTAISFFVVLLVLISGCTGNKMVFEQNAGLSKLGNPIKIEYYKNIAGEAFRYSETPEFVITNEKELQSAMDEIKNACDPELRKGAGWNRIEIHYTGTVIRLNTSNQKIGESASGSFYDLGEENFITKRLKANH